MNVDLPEPDGPTTATNSPRVDVERDATEGVHRRALHGVGLGDVLRGNQRRVVRRRRHSVLFDAAAVRAHSVLRGAGAGPFLPAKL